MKHFIFGISLFIGGILGNGAIFIAVGVSGRLSRNILGSIDEFDPKTTTVQELGLYMAGARKQGKGE